MSYIKNKESHVKYIDLCLEEAVKNENELPVGALIIFNGEIIARSHNLKETLNDPTAHAEMIVIKETCKKLNSWRLEGAILYVSLEPCPMCASAIINSRVSTVCFGAYDSLYGAFVSAMDMRNFYNSKINVISGVREQKCTDVLKSYFEKLRGSE